MNIYWVVLRHVASYLVYGGQGTKLLYRVCTTGREYCVHCAGNCAGNYAVSLPIILGTCGIVCRNSKAPTVIVAGVNI